MELILVRHAQPLEESRRDGRPADPPLSPRGRVQADAVARWLAQDGVDRLISSPALRARQTADAVARLTGLAVEIDPRLRDANEGDERYVPLELQKARDPAAYRAHLSAYRESPRLSAIADRVIEALDAWTTGARGERVSVFCHGSVVNVYASKVLGLEPQAFLEADYASAHRFLISGTGVRSVRSLNETAYLPR